MAVIQSAEPFSGVHIAQQMLPDRKQVHPFIRHLSVAEYTFEPAVETDFTNHCIIKVEHLKCWS